MRKAVMPSEAVVREVMRRMVAGERDRYIAAALEISYRMVRRIWDAYRLPDDLVLRQAAIVASAVRRQAAAMPPEPRNCPAVPRAPLPGSERYFDDPRAIADHGSALMPPRPATWIKSATSSALAVG